jgi:predicted lipoprotein with Yx(FWY)xxD motif
MGAFVLTAITIFSGILLPLLAKAEDQVFLPTPATPAPEVIAVGSSDATGPIYTTSLGMTLYTTALDKPGSGVFGCSDTRFETAGSPTDGYPTGYPLPRAKFRPTCIDRWSPFLAQPGSEPSGRWSIVTRPDGQTQWAYDEGPLYTSNRDLKPGDVNGTMGLTGYGVWKTVQLDLWFPPGIKLVRKVDGLLLATEDDGRLIFTNDVNAEEAVQDWIPLYVPELGLPGGQFDVIVHEDSSKQWAFNGMPLYRSRSHVQNHIIQQHVKAKRWRPVVYQKARERPDFVTMQMTVPEVGWVYATPEGKTMYIFYCFDRGADGLHCDEPGDAAAHRSAVCGTGEQCSREWRPVLAKPDDESVGNWRIADVPDPPFKEATGAYGEDVPTVRAWTYHGRPVYTFAVDKAPGDILGHGLEARSSGYGAITVLGDEFPALP